MTSPSMGQRRFDIGAAYFTVSETEFDQQVRAWQADGVAREWTDTFEVVGPDGRSSTTGPMRWSSSDGIGSLVHALEPEERPGNNVAGLDELDHEVIVLAMPDPQAARLAPDAFGWVEYQPVIAVAFEWAERNWDLQDAAFVNDDPDVTTVADDGARRGDGAPVLVAHTTPRLARATLDDPDAAISPVFAALRRLFGVSADPRRSFAHRWTFAQPTTTHGDEPFGLTSRDRRLLGVCGDSWCPAGNPRVEAAYLSGARLGRELGDRLA